MNSLRGAKAEEVFNSLLLSGSFLLEEDSDSNKSIKNNKIYDVLFTQYETNSTQIESMLCQLTGCCILSPALGCLCNPLFPYVDSSGSQTN